MLRWIATPALAGSARESTAKCAGFDNPAQQIADFINLPLEICKKSAMIVFERL